MLPSGQTTRRVLPPGEYDRRAMSHFAKLLLPLLLLLLSLCQWWMTTKRCATSKKSAMLQSISFGSNNGHSTVKTALGILEV